MSEHCGFKPFQDCNCGNECKSATIPLQRFTKARDMRGVFLPSTCTLLAIIAFFAISTAVGLTIIQLREDARAYKLARNV